MSTKSKPARRQTGSRPKRTKFDSAVRHARVRQSYAPNLRITDSTERSRVPEGAVQRATQSRRSLQKQSNRFADSKPKPNVDLLLGQRGEQSRTRKAVRKTKPKAPGSTLLPRQHSNLAIAPLANSIRRRCQLQRAR